MDNTVQRAGAADVIAYAFYQMGYRPRQSLVLVGMQGAHRRLGLVVRMDLPPNATLSGVLHPQLSQLERFGDDALFAIVISDEDSRQDREVAALPHRRLVGDLRRETGRHGWRLQDVLWVGSDRWRSYTCRDTSCCPLQGRPLQEALTSAVATVQIAGGRVLAADEAALVADVVPRPLPGGASPGQGAADAWTGPCLDAPQALRRWRALVEAAGVSTEPLAPAALGWLTEALEDRWLRDAILVTLVPDAGTAPEELLAGGDEAVLEGLLEHVPDPALLERGRVVLSAVARQAPPGSRAEALALLAWMSWWAGEGPRARLLAQRALADQPRHRLAGLVDSLLRVGVVPAWVQRRSVTARPSREGGAPVGDPRPDAPTG